MTEKKQMCLDNLNLVYYVIKRLKLQKENDEYFSIGVIGLMKAINSFDESKNIKFSTFAVNCIRNEILKERKKMIYDKRKANLNTLSLDNDAGNETFKDLLKSNDNTEQEVIKKEREEVLNKCISILDKREKIIILNCYKLYGNNLSIVEMSSRLGITKSRIHQIKTQALIKIKNELIKCNYEI